MFRVRIRGFRGSVGFRRFEKVEICRVFEIVFLGVMEGAIFECRSFFSSFKKSFSDSIFTLSIYCV